jgi:hypothetical protein
VTIARNAGWDDTRLGFSFFALGRLTLSRDVERSVQAFQTAAAIFERTRRAASSRPMWTCRLPPSRCRRAARTRRCA